MKAELTIVMPYWRRANVLLETLKFLDSTYRNELNLQVIVVDDGSHDVEVNHDWVNLIRLPKKTGPKNPCTPFNIGIDQVKTEFICLTNPETISFDPILVDLLDIAKRTSENAYLLPAVFCDGHQQWKQHSKFINCGLHWLTVCRTELVKKAGKFDEDYRDGAGWEDNDFVRRLEQVDTLFVNCDHLTAVHQRLKQNNLVWPAHMTFKNQDIYLKKWGNLDRLRSINSIDYRKAIRA